MISINANIAIPEEELEFTFIRSSGPGGQNVNKVSTAVQLRFNAATSPSLYPYIRERLIRLAGKRATDEGIIIIQAHRFRTQEQNRADAITRLSALINAAATPPKPRRATHPTQASIRRRVENKRQHSTIKQLRKSVPLDND